MFSLDSTVSDCQGQVQRAQWVQTGFGVGMMGMESCQMDQGGYDDEDSVIIADHGAKLNGASSRIRRAPLCWGDRKNAK